MTSVGTVTAGDSVLCADGVSLGVVEADEQSHIRIHRAESPQTIWAPKFAIDRIEDGVIRLALDRDDLHDGIIALPPARQREYGTLEGLSLMVMRARRGGSFAPPTLQG